MALDAAAITRALRQLAMLQAAWHEVQPQEGVRQVAQSLLRLHPLRVADSPAAIGGGADCLRTPTATVAVPVPGCPPQFGGRARGIRRHSPICVTSANIEEGLVNRGPPVFWLLFRFNNPD